MLSVANPYTLNLCRYDKQAFFGRRDEITLLEEGALCWPPRSFALVGPRSIGKTWLLRFLCDPSRQKATHEADLFAIYCDLRSKPVGNPIFRLCEELILSSDSLLHAIPACRGEMQALRVAWEQIDPSLSRAEDEQRVSRGSERLRDALRRLCLTIARDEGHRLQICLDHFGDVLEIMDHGEEAFLRELVSTTSFVVTINPNIFGRYLEAYRQTSPFLNMMLLRHIGALPEIEARRLINEPLACEAGAGIAFTEEETRFLLDCAGRHPFLLTLACDYYFQHHRPGLKLDHANVRERMIHEMLALPEVTKYCTTIWYQLSPQQQHLVQLIAQRVPVATIEHYRIALKEVMSRALLAETEATGEYRLFAQIFEHYVLEHIHTVAYDLAPSDQLANIEHELTPIDRKLWNYLQQHPDQICTREELLEHVWGTEETSARGLEAAIYRIRAKLHEVGIGNWEYIQTSRGQGYKFVPRLPVNTRSTSST